MEAGEDLDFAACSIGEVGLRAVSERIPAELTSLRLNLTECIFEDNTIGEAGAIAVAEQIPAGLASLNLNFSFCSIGEVAARAVAAHAERFGELPHTSTEQAVVTAEA